MRVSYKWLQEYVPTKLDPTTLAEKFQMTSSVVEGIEDYNELLDGLIVGQVKKVIPHPKADRLQIATVSTGHTQHQIVCGAPNLQEGQCVIVALAGTVLHPLKGLPVTIEEATIRGTKSAGMLCSAEEIGLALPSDGIFILDSKSVPGTAVSLALDLNDTVIDLEITPNRPDLLSYLGLAREVATFEHKSLQQPAIYSQEARKSLQSRKLAVQVETNLCRRYSTVYLENLVIASSPWWLQKRLLLSGIRPVNNVVDVTNYVMLELGQPLHAFDYTTLPAPHIVVRTANRGEKINLLDGTTRALETEDLVISNSDNQALALAGLMGGKDSAISAGTTRIILEAATFAGGQIRRTSRRLGLRSESSTRFEKGLDPELTVTALKRAIYLLKEIAAAEVSSPITDIYPHSHAARPRLHLDFARLQQISGVRISVAEIKSTLQKLGFQLPSLTKSSLEAIPPSWRADVSLPEDLIEEILRIWGYERLPLTLPSGPITPPSPNLAFEQKKLMRHTLASLGWHETMNTSILSAKALAQVGFNLRDALALENPLSAEHSHLIPSHLIQFLENISQKNQQQTSLALFEIGHIFTSNRTEVEKLSFLLRREDQPELLIAQAKMALKRLAQVLQLAEPEYGVNREKLEIRWNDQLIGESYLVPMEVVAKFKIRSGRQILFAEIDLDLLNQLPKQTRLYQTPPLYPSIERDLTLIVGKDVTVARITSALEKGIDSELIREWEIQTVYQGKPLEPDQKSVTLHFVYNHPKRTLVDAEVSQDQEMIVKLSQKLFKAIIRP